LNKNALKIFVCVGWRDSSRKWHHQYWSSPIPAQNSVWSKCCNTLWGSRTSVWQHVHTSGDWHWRSH